MSNFSPERTHALYEWQEKDEYNLLLAVQAISQESVENYNPDINLFDRIEIILNKRFGYEAILSKIKELKQRFDKTRGFTESNFEVEMNRVFLISKDIWGREQNNGELGSNRSVENGNVEAEDETKDAERNGTFETEFEEEGAQSGSGNEMVDTEDREDDGQSGFGNETMEVEEEANNSQRDEIMEMEHMEKETQRGEIMNLEDMEKDTQRDFKKETMEANDKKIEIKRGVGNEKVEMEDKEPGKQSDETREIEGMEKDTESDETREIEGMEKDTERYFEKETMEANDNKNEIKRGVGNEKIEMEDKEQGKHRDFEKETMEVNDNKNEIKRGVGNEKIEMKDKEQGKQRVKAVRIGVRCSKAVKLKSIVSPSIKVLKRAINFRRKQKQLNVGGTGAKSNVRTQPAYKVLKNRTSMQKDSKDEILCFSCGKAGQMECGCTLENKIMEPLTEEQSTTGTLKDAGLKFENLSKSKEVSTASVLSKIKNRDNESKCMESNKCGKSVNVTNKKGLRTVLLEKRKQRHNFKSQPVSKKQTLLEKRNKQQNLESPPVNKKQTVLLEKRKLQQNLKSPPVNKKQKTGVKLYECGDLGDTASSCVQRKVMEDPTKKQETSDGITVEPLEATANKTAELSNESEPIRSEPVPKEHTANMIMEEKCTISESVSYHHTSDNMTAESSGETNSETTNNKAVESSSTTKPIRSEPVPNGSKANKDFKEKSTILGSCSYHHTPDNMKAEGAGNFESETAYKKSVESSNETKPLRSEPDSEENTSNKNSGGKATVSKSSSYHQTSEETGNSKFDDHNRPTLEQGKPPVNEPGSNNELTSKKNSEEKSDCPSHNGKQTSEQKNANEHSSNSPLDSTSEQGMKPNKVDSELRRESLSNNAETVRHQSSHEHKKESCNSRHSGTAHRYDEWRQNSSSRSPSLLHGHTYANSYPQTPSRQAEDVRRFQSVSHQYSFESLAPRTYSNYSRGYAPSNLRANVSHLQGGEFHDFLRAEYQYAQVQRMRERNSWNQNGYNYAHYHSYNGRDVGRHQSYATQQPPLPPEPYPYPPPPPPPYRTEPYWHR